MKIQSCPFCNSDYIGYMERIISRFEDGRERAEVWAFCRGCGHRGLIAKGIFKSDDEKKEAAYRMWNTER